MLWNIYMSYKALYDIWCFAKRHMDTHAIFRWSARGGKAWHRNVWRPVYVRPSLQLSLTLACIKAMSKTLHNLHGASHDPAPPRAPADVVHRNLVRSPREDFFWKIIRPNSSFGGPGGSLSSGVRNAHGCGKQTPSASILFSHTNLRYVCNRQTYA